MKPNRTKRLILGKKNAQITILLPGLKSHEVVRIQMPKRPMDLFELSGFIETLERGILAADRMARDLQLRRQANGFEK